MLLHTVNDLHVHSSAMLAEPGAGQLASRAGTNFSDLFSSATAPTSKASLTSPTPPPSEPALGQPNVQSWLNSYYAEQEAAHPSSNDTNAANISYQAAAGAGSNYAVGDAWGPDAIFSQALENQAGNAFAQLTGENAANFTSQLPGMPTQQAQNEYDQRLALSNAERLASGQPIDTSAYWSDPGPVTLNGVTYTSAQLGYCGPGQSSGAEPIYISQANQVGPDTFTVGGYSGTVTGIQPGRFYTLQQLEQAGLSSGQPDNQFHPGSWSETTTS